ncbi:FAD-dependent oxidoreductase [Sphingomonas sp. RP10(2022)]|uniref:FAD-dependent oxidoreductase n=1 Tax=Sphingomonas liriopis TaxID=2949094 RepID=A0A9X2KUE3_9SPHN|nr:FAD-dependent oxidoreductase [Sphingomonas liriopis]MCP3735898.1 FAD-dependent oxidoreductase [Sphingomonas liriopis]
MVESEAMATWDKEVDVLVVGTGAGGLTAAINAADAHGDVLVVEKADEFGGTSATSGGGIWIPASDLARDAGQADSAEEAFAYIRPQSAANVPDGTIKAFVDQAPRMLRWLHAKTPVRYDSVPYPDYHVEYEGGKHGFRTHLPRGIDGRLLGDDILKLRSASPAASLGGIVNWSFTDTNYLLFRHKGWQKVLAKMLWAYASDWKHRLRSRKDRNLTLGNALVGGLWIALRERKVPVWLDTPLVDLVEENGAITGAIVRHEGKTVRVRARRGVILAAGGFERNAEMRAEHLPGSPDPTISGSQVNNTGDAINAAARIGAGLRNMQSTWCAPVFRVPGEDRARLSSIERALPGSMMVNRDGRRFLNEAASYHVVGQKMIEGERSGGKTSPAWFVFDATYRKKYPAGPLFPIVPDALQLKGVRETMKKASSVEGLAAAIGVPADTLKATLARFNADAITGVDTEFDRGGPAYDRMYGDPSVKPNPTLAPIVAAPFYALPIYGGDIGTNGGIVTDENARALDTDGHVIAGLYAIGNTAASVMGESYPGAGVTLGPAMTFGYVAARHAMGVNA